MTSTPQHIEDLIAHERAQFIAQYQAVPAGRRTERPASGGWSAAEVVEHVTRVETGVVVMITKGASLPRTATEAELADAQITERKARIVRDRSVKVEAPARVHPQNTVDAEAVLAQLVQSREALLTAFRAADAAVLDGVTYPHPFIGPLTLRAWVELIAHHDARHAQQIAELFASPTKES